MSVLRVSDELSDDLKATARLFGVTPGALLARSWEAYRETAEFKDDFEFIQKCVSAGDLRSITKRLAAQQRSEAARMAAAARSSQTEDA